MNEAKSNTAGEGISALNMVVSAIQVMLTPQDICDATMQQKLREIKRLKDILFAADRASFSRGEAKVDWGDIPEPSRRRISPRKGVRVESVRTRRRQVEVNPLARARVLYCLLSGRTSPLRLRLHR